MRLRITYTNGLFDVVSIKTDKDFKDELESILKPTHTLFTTTEDGRTICVTTKHIVKIEQV